MDRFDSFGREDRADETGTSRRVGVESSSGPTRVSPRSGGPVTISEITKRLTTKISAMVLPKMFLLKMKYRRCVIRDMTEKYGSRFV